MEKELSNDAGPLSPFCKLAARLVTSESLKRFFGHRRKSIYRERRKSLRWHNAICYSLSRLCNPHPSPTSQHFGKIQSVLSVRGRRADKSSMSHFGASLPLFDKRHRSGAIQIQNQMTNLWEIVDEDNRDQAEGRTEAYTHTGGRDPLKTALAS